MMDRRSFFKYSAAGIAAAGLTAVDLKALTLDPALPPRLSGTAAGASPVEKLRLKFLGTGASGGKSEPSVRQARGTRQSSVLLDAKILIDLTADALDLLPKDFRPECIFYTHSHGDHYNPKVAVGLNVPKVYVSETWYDRALADFTRASEELGLPSPDVIPLKTGRSVRKGSLTFTPLPANHVTSDFDEQALIYLIQKGTTRLLYATDTGGIMGKAARMAGIDAHLSEEKRNPITALIMEATMGEDDFRIFNHSSLQEVVRTVRILSDTGTYRPAPGQPVWVTHRARSLHGNHSAEELDALWPEPLKAATDGMEIEI